MSKKALCVGINDYPGTMNDLNGCVNDANDWSDLLQTTFGFNHADVSLVLDSAATKANIIGTPAAPGKLRTLVSNAKSGDVIVFTYSGHGTSIVDTSGDDVDGRDEALCLFDNIVIDDELAEIFNSMENGVNLTFISDSCHSGTVNKAMLERRADGFLEKDDPKVHQRPRFMPPEVAAKYYDLPSDLIVAPGWWTYLVPVFSGILQLFVGRKEVLISGCKDDEYSYDAYIAGKYNGAMSAHAIAIMKSNPNDTYEGFYKKLKNVLPSANYPQSPQLRGSSSSKKNKLFT